ncbi:MAG: TRAM domain-containing protein [Chlamydiales bacterium]|nr:TRAM domain-containing protein [Chlamydiia bacterium]MCP5507300.1 TRAM domain-containing protein [Chlamydiales bacterium]
MKISLSFIRTFFLLMCILFSTAYTMTMNISDTALVSMGIGIVGGVLFAIAVIGLEKLFNKFDLRSLNIALIGLFIGYLMGQGIMLIFSSVVDVAELPMSESSLTLARLGIYLVTAYMGMFLTLSASEELYVSLPFIKLKPAAVKKRDIILDRSMLNDPRVIDLAASGLVNNQLIVPRFLLKELYEQHENGEEGERNRARRALEVLKKLEDNSTLGLRINDHDFPEVKDRHSKLVKLARFVEANIMTADMSRVEQSAIEDVVIINFQSLCNALKPLTQSGEYINIKVQRYGKEPRQGVGYLEDGTMVVINGGAEYIGEAIKAQVLSVKHTSSGRMIFCNAVEEGYEDLDQEHEYAGAAAGSSNNDSSKRFFTL